MTMVIRDAVEMDWPAIVEIYNQSIPGGTSTADTSPVTVADRIDWFRKFDPQKRPLWVAEIDGEIVAWIGLTSFYAGRPAYDATAEVSTYIATAHHKKGIGTALKKRMIEKCPDFGVTTLVSVAFDHNDGTRRMNEKLGFVQAGHLPEIAEIAGVKIGVVYSLRRIVSCGDTFLNVSEKDRK